MKDRLLDHANMVGVGLVGLEVFLSFLAAVKRVGEVEGGGLVREDGNGD